jgi:hypothetical protein
MLSRVAVALVISVISAGLCRAEQPSVRIDLTTPRLVGSFAAIPFVFEDSNLDCPEDRTAIAVTNGVFHSHHLSLPPFEQPMSQTKYGSDPIDDSTYRLQIIRPNCRVEIDIRQQVRVDGEWKSLLVIKERRPSLSSEAQEAVRERLKDMPAPKLATTETLADINKMLRGKGPKRWGAVTLRLGFPFDEAPKFCMDVFGEYQIANNRFAMSFFAPLPGELNKFVLEGSDLDPSHARIVLTKDDCRFVFTISQSIMHGGQWIALPLRSAPDDKTAKPADSGP